MPVPPGPGPRPPPPPAPCSSASTVVAARAPGRNVIRTAWLPGVVNVRLVQVTGAGGDGVGDEVGDEVGDGVGGGGGVGVARVVAGTRPA